MPSAYLWEKRNNVPPVGCVACGWLCTASGELKKKTSLEQVWLQAEAENTSCRKMSLNYLNGFT
jgi:hypothetical protein